MSSNRKNIIKFCELVDFINTKNAYLQKEKESFYNGGHSFEECYSEDIKILNTACDALEHYFKIIG